MNAEPNEKPIRILSLGAGVQSSTIALMMGAGEIESCEAAIFADTKAEPKKVYIWLDWLEKQLPFPVYRVVEKKGLTKNIEDNCNGLSTWCSDPPMFTITKKGFGQIKRQCTGEFKLAPIRRKTQELRGKRKVVSVIGISHDEHQRCSQPDVKYIIHNEYPLCERQMTRRDCINWMHKHYFPTPPTIGLCLLSI